MLLEIETMISDDNNILGIITIESLIKCAISGGLA